MRAEYKKESHDLKHYIHHLIQRYEGEVALAWSDWTYVNEPLPRDVGLWDQQFALNEANYKALKDMGRISTVPGTHGQEMHPSVDLAAAGNTTILRTKPGIPGHWRLNGRAISLPELFDKFGEEFTVSELMLWYFNAPKVLRKR